jgi:hypothetical protein
MAVDGQAGGSLRNNALWFRLLRALLLAATVTALFCASVYIIGGCPKDNSGWCGLLPLLGGFYVFVASFVVLLFASIISKHVKVQLLISLLLLTVSVAAAVLFASPR